LFTVSDFISLLRYLKGEPENVDLLLQELLVSEKASTLALFDAIVDQYAFASDDYKRLRKFLIDWYSALKTLVSVSRNVTDVFTLPETHIEELLRSMGLPFPTYRISSFNKILLLLDLVRLYKTKGTPTSLSSSLRYLGIVNNPDIVEYFLTRIQTQSGPDFVFRPSIVQTSKYITTPLIQLPSRSSGLDPIKISIESYTAPLVDLLYEDVKRLDPHWMLEKDTLSFLAKGRSLPMKTPHFAIRENIPLSDQLAIISAVTRRRVRDEYETFLQTQELNRVIRFSLYPKTKLSLLEIYVACCYCLNRYYGQRTSGFADSFLIYDGTSSDLATIINEFTNLYFQRLVTRDEQKEFRNQFLDLFTRPISSDFLTPLFSSPEQVLKQINLDLFNYIDSWFASSNGDSITTEVLFLLTSYIDLYILPEGYPRIATTIGPRNIVNRYILDVVNFFKPHRARFLGLIHTLYINSPLMDGVVSEDKLQINYEKDLLDFHTMDSEPCCGNEYVICHDSTVTDLYHSRDHYDCGSYHDVGVSDDKSPEEVVINYYRTLPEVVRSFPVFQGIWQNDPQVSCSHYIDSTTYNWYMTILDGTSVPIYTICTGSMPEFDCEGCFDIPTSQDYTYIKAFVVADLALQSGTKRLLKGQNIEHIEFKSEIPDGTLLTPLCVTMVSDSTGVSDQYFYIITQRDRLGFTIRFSAPIVSEEYTLSWMVHYAEYPYVGKRTGVSSIPANSTSMRVSFSQPLSSGDYSLSTTICNVIEESPRMLFYDIVSKDENGFDIEFSASVPTSHYQLNWVASEN